MPNDELARRRLLRAVRRPIAPPPMDGSVKVVVEDLTTVCGMVEEVVAETQSLPVGNAELLTAVVELEDAATKAYAKAKQAAGEEPPP